jgi:hypothetical protein
MRVRFCWRAVFVLALTVVPARAADPYAVKVVDSAPPKEVPEPIRKLLSERCTQFLDDKGNLLAEVWFRKELPSKATEAQFKNGLTLKEIPESTIMAVIRADKELGDYRKQKVKPGLYTLRLGYQPQDGDHMGTAPNNEFCLACPLAEDKGAATLPAKALHELSKKSTGEHPGVFLLFPAKDAGEPKLVGKGEGHWCVQVKLPVVAGGLKGDVGIALTLIGTSPSA